MSEFNINTRIANKYDLAENWVVNNPVLLAGELGIESDTQKIKVGDGQTAWNDLLYITGEAIVDSTISDTSLKPVQNKVVNEFVIKKDAETLAKAKAYTDTTRPTPDWNQNDSTSKDYIKNRTHYKTVTVQDPAFITSDELVLNYKDTDYPASPLIDLKEAYVANPEQTYKMTVYKTGTDTVVMTLSNLTVIDATDEVYPEGGAPGEIYVLEDYSNPDEPIVAYINNIYMDVNTGDLIYDADYALPYGIVVYLLDQGESIDVDCKFEKEVAEGQEVPNPIGITRTVTTYTQLDKAYLPKDFNDNSPVVEEFDIGWKPFATQPKLFINDVEQPPEKLSEILAIKGRGFYNFYGINPSESVDNYQFTVQRYNEISTTWEDIIQDNLPNPISDTYYLELPVVQPTNNTEYMVSIGPTYSNDVNDIKNTLCSIGDFRNPNTSIFVDNGSIYNTNYGFFKFGISCAGNRKDKNSAASGRYLVLQPPETLQNTPASLECIIISYMWPQNIIEKLPISTRKAIHVYPSMKGDEHSFLYDALDINEHPNNVGLGHCALLNLYNSMSAEAFKEYVNTNPMTTPYVIHLKIDFTNAEQVLLDIIETAPRKSASDLFWHSTTLFHINGILQFWEEPSLAPIFNAVKKMDRLTIDDPEILFGPRTTVKCIWR